MKFDHPAVPAVWEYIEYPIQGQMLVGKMILSDYDSTGLSDKRYRDHIRHTITKKLAEEIVKHKFAEWTQFKDPLSGATTIMIRAYLAKDKDVHLLRTLAKE